MKNLFKYLIILLIAGIILGIEPIYGQSALGQLEDIAGQKVSVPAASAPVNVSNIVVSRVAAAAPKISAAANMNNMVGGMLVQGLLNSLFSSPSPSKAEVEAQQKAAELAAQQAAEKAAEEQRIKEAEAQAAHDKMMQSYKQLDGSQDLGMKTLDNDGLNLKTFDKGSAIPIMRSQKEANVDEYFRTHFSPVSSDNGLDADNFKNEPLPFYTKELLQQEQHLIIVGTGLLVKGVSGGMLSNAVSWGSPVLEEGILKPTEDYFMTGKCPTTGKILENEFNASKSNIASLVGEKTSEGLGTLAAKTVGGDVTKFAKLGKTTFGTVYDVADTGKELWENGGKEMWGSITGKTAADAIQKAEQMKNMKY
jgi:hypothetical protein